MRHSNSLSFSLAATALCILAGSAPAPAQDAPRRPKGPIAGPVIKLPRGHYDPPAANAEEVPPEEEATPSARLKWEYCALTHLTTQRKSFGSDSISVAHVRYFHGGSETFEGANEDEAFAIALTKLGEEGWELVAIRNSFHLSDGNGSSTSSYFFKRPR